VYLSGLSAARELAPIAPQLEASYREAIDDGDTSAWADLGQLLALQGRGEEAEACFRAAVDAGELEALIAVALLVGSRPEMKDEAERMLRLAALAGHAEASLLLGVLLTDRLEARADAEAAYRAALEAGLERASDGLALL
jgi:hypothetical protein